MQKEGWEKAEKHVELGNVRNENSTNHTLFDAVKHFFFFQSLLTLALFS